MTYPVHPNPRQQYRNEIQRNAMRPLSAIGTAFTELQHNRAIAAVQDDTTAGMRKRLHGEPALRNHVYAALVARRTR